MQDFYPLKTIVQCPLVKTIVQCSLYNINYTGKKSIGVLFYQENIISLVYYDIEHLHAKKMGYVSPTLFTDQNSYG
jgi:hypothetical protein